MQELRLGTRGSQLALWQARAVASRISAAGGPLCRIIVIKTSGDRIEDAPLSEAGGKRLFVKEIEEALLGHDIDLAVHSSKDMPAVLPDGLVIGGVLPREDPLDAVVLPLSRSRLFETVDELASELRSAPTFGTGSVRRIAQLARLFPHASFAPIRGNLNTRLAKLDAGDPGDYDALVLAAAGLRRLGLATRVSMTLPVGACVPAPGQGIVAIEVREDDEPMRRILRGIDDPATSAALTAERSLVAALGGGCQTPVGALAMPTDAQHIELVATVAALDGTRIVRASGSGSTREAAELGIRVASALVAQGADDILASALGVQGMRSGPPPRH